MKFRTPQYFAYFYTFCSVFFKFLTDFINEE
jgi:hypothetical protein